MVSIVIANKDHLEDLQRCITSIMDKSNITQIVAADTVMTVSRRPVCAQAQHHARVLDRLVLIVELRAHRAHIFALRIHEQTKWKEVLETGDPYYNVNFSLDRSDFALKI